MVKTVMYTFRSSTAVDYAFLYQLHVATMKPYVAQVWGWDEQMQAERFRQHVDPIRQRIVVVDGQEIGVLEVEERPSDLFLANLRILPEFQRQGCGTRILRDLLLRDLLLRDLLLHAHNAGVPVTQRPYLAGSAILGLTSRRLAIIFSTSAN